MITHPVGLLLFGRIFLRPDMTSSNSVDNNSVVQPGDLSRERGEKFGQKGVMTKQKWISRLDPWPESKEGNENTKSVHVRIWDLN